MAGTVHKSTSEETHCELLDINYNHLIDLVLKVIDVNVLW